MTYTHIRPASFVLNPQAKLPKYVSLEFPQAWIGPLLGWYAQAQERSGQPVSLPVQSLNAALRTLVPDLVGIQRNAGIQKNGPSQPWLYSAQAIQPQHLLVILQAWARAEFSKVPHLYQQIFDLMQAQDLIWKPASITPQSSGFYSLLPDVIAAHLEQHTTEASGVSLQWKRAPTAPGDSGAELISYPPLEHRGFLWSVLVTITVQTLPFQATPVIHIDLGMRRWEGRGSNQKPIWLGSGNTSAYILTSVPWISGLHHSGSFQVAQLRNFKTQENLFKVDWADKLPEILKALNANHLPDPRAILEYPIQKTADCKNDVVLVAFRNDTSTSHSVETGFSPFDRRQLLEGIAVALKPMLEFTPLLPHEKISPGVALAKNVFESVGRQGKQRKDESEYAAKQKEIQQEIAATLEGRLRATRAVTPSVKIELWTEPAAPTLPALRTALRECFGIEERDGKFIQGSLEIEVQTVLSHGIIPDLRSGEELSFFEHIARQLGPVYAPTLAIIELPGKDHWKKENKPDPQRAIRQAFAKTGRVVQFIVPDPDNQRIRATRALLDGLRQFGVHDVAGWFKNLKGFGSSLGVLGFWLLDHYIPTGKGNQTNHYQLPIAVYLSTEQPGVQVSAPWQVGARFVSYPEALARIARGEARPFGTSQNRLENAMSFVTSILDEFRDHPNLLILAHAQNFRRVWSWLSNKNLQIDALPVTGRLLTLQDRPNWRVVRTRDGTSNEVPEWFGIRAGGEGQGPTKGVFKINERTFFTSQSRSDTMQTPQKLTKFGERANPRKSAPQPNLLEVTFPFVPSLEDLSRWAALISELRNLSIQHGDATRLPYPLHMAKKIEEYLPAN